MERNLVLGVDAGSATIVATLAEVAKGEPHVIGVGVTPSAGLHRGLVVNAKAAEEAIRQAIHTACQMAECTTVNRAVVSVSGAHIYSLVGEAETPVHRPAAGVTPEDIRRALDAAAGIPLPEGREVVHVAPRSYWLDGNGPIREPLGLAGRLLRAEVQLVTGEALPIQNHLRVVRDLGLEIVDYQVAVRAAAEAVLTTEERESGVLLLDVGAGTTGVTVYDQGRLFSVSVLPVGSEHITQDIATLLRLPVATAEQVKRERGWAIPDLAPETTFELVSPSGRKVLEIADKKVAEIIAPRVEEILQLAAAAVKRSGYTGLFPGGLVLTGGGSRLQGMVEVAADCLTLPARIGRPQGPLVAEPELATAAGLVRWGANLSGEEAAVAAERPNRTGTERFRHWLKALFH